LRPLIASSGGKELVQVTLCPTHHTLIDKAPAQFPPSLLREWKAQHESRIATTLNAPSFANKNELYLFIQKRLAENRLIHQNVGPDSALAQDNPLTSAVDLWIFRKLAMVIPNNRKIIDAFIRILRVLGSSMEARTLELRKSG